MLLTTFTDEGAPGDVVTVPLDRAKLLRRGGAARGATPDDAMRLDVATFGP